MNLSEFNIDRITEATNRAFSLNNYMPNIEPPKIKYNSITEQIKNDKRIREIDNLIYEIEWEEQQQEDNKIKLKALEKSNDIKTGLEALIYSTLSGVIIPFLFLIYYEYINDFYGENIILTVVMSVFIGLLFIISLLFIAEYLKKIVKKWKCIMCIFFIAKRRYNAKERSTRYN